MEKDDPRLKHGIFVRITSTLYTNREDEMSRSEAWALWQTGYLMAQTHTGIAATGVTPPQKGDPWPDEITWGGHILVGEVSASKFHWMVETIRRGEERKQGSFEILLKAKKVACIPFKGMDYLGPGFSVNSHQRRGRRHKMRIPEVPYGEEAI